MSGIFGVVSKDNCIKDLFYGTDYHTHLGTGFGGIAVQNGKFIRHIHNISQSQFKSKFYEDYEALSGPMGVGVISDNDEQPIYLNAKFGPFCIVTAGLIEKQGGTLPAIAEGRDVVQ
jgi:amidophosphoribosyltransferase (EC 2.4.2.14)